MNTSANLTALHITSAKVLADGLLGNSIRSILTMIAFLMSTTQILTIYLWKPLRDMQQILVLNAAWADIVKSIGYGVPGFKRLYLISFGGSEVINQYDCMYWIFGMTFGTLYGLSAVLMLSVERFIVIASPVFYRNYKNKLLWSLSILSIGVSLLATVFLFLGASDKLLLTSCNLTSSTTSAYYTFLVYFQDATTGGIIFFNCATGVSLLRRWRTAVKANADMSAFKREIQFNAVKSVFAVVILCLSSYFAAMILMAAIANFDSVRRAYYGPFWGCFQMMRGVFDFGLFLVFNKKYQEAFSQVFVKRNCRKANVRTDPVTSFVTNNGNTPKRRVVSSWQ